MNVPKQLTLLSVLLILLLNPLKLWGADITTLQNNQFQSLNLKIIEIEQKKGLLGKQFLEQLTLARQQSVRLGFLDRIEALDEEIASFLFNRKISEEPTLDGEVAKYRDHYHSQIEHYEWLQAKTVAQWHDTYKAEMDKAIQSALSNGLIAVAKEGRSKSDAVESSELVSSAKARLEQTNSKGEQQEPVAPHLDSGWTRLPGVEFEAKGGRYFNSDRSRIKEVSYGQRTYNSSHFLHNHSNGQYTFTFTTPVTAFKAVGCIESRSRKGNVIFSVQTREAGEVYRSQAVHSRRRGEEIEVEFAPTQSLTIEVLPNGDGSEDWGVWLKPSVKFDLPKSEEISVAIESTSPQSTKLSEESKQSRESGAVTAARHYFTLLSAEKFDEVPEVFHPDAANEFGELTKHIFTLPKEQGESFLSMLFGNDANLGMLRKANNTKRYGVFITGMQKRFAGMPGLSKAYEDAEFLGAVNEADTAYVLVRVMMPDPQGGNGIEAFEVLSFKEHEGQWMLLMTAKAKKPLLTLKNLTK